MKPMLAFKFQDKQKVLSYPLFVQPKLNGFRCVSKGAGSTLVSREQHEWNQSQLKKIRNQIFELTQFLKEDCVFDGELYRHGWSLQRISRCVAVGRKSPHEDEDEIKYNIFDLVYRSNLLAPFSERIKKLNVAKMFLDLPNIEFVPTHFVTKSEAEELYAYYRKEGYEGTMYRTDEPYGFSFNCGNQENRWKCLLKRKDWLDDDFKVVEYIHGKTGTRLEYSVGSLLLETSEGLQFTAGSGLSDSDRDRIMAGDLPTSAKINFEMYSDGGIPLKPTIELLTYA